MVRSCEVIPLKSLLVLQIKVSIYGVFLFASRKKKERR